MAQGPDRYVIGHARRAAAIAARTPYERALTSALTLATKGEPPSRRARVVPDALPEPVTVKQLDAPNMAPLGSVVFLDAAARPSVALIAVDRSLIQYDCATRHQEVFGIANVRCVDAFRGTSCAVTSDDSHACVYDLSASHIVSRFRVGRPAHVRAFDANLCCLSDDGGERVWMWDRRAPRPQPVGSPTRLGHTPVMDCSLRQLAAVSEDKSILLWDTRRLDRPMHVLPAASPDRTPCVAWHPTRLCTLTIASSTDVHTRADGGALTHLLRTTHPAVALAWSHHDRSTTLFAALTTGTTSMWTSRHGLKSLGSASHTDVLHADGTILDLAVSSRYVVGVDALAEVLHVGALRRSTVCAKAHEPWGWRDVR